VSASHPAPVPPKAMTIAGSDSGGGAGIQADLKTFSALGVYGSSVITAITAQNTCSVTAVHEIPVDVIDAQIDAVMEDIGAAAVKTGMLSSPEIVTTVAVAVERHNIDRLVVDPVMVAKSGDRLLAEEAVEAVRSRLLPLAYVVTPNIPEAEVLSGMTIHNENEMIEAAKRIHELGVDVALVKGGHLSGDPIDIAWDGSTVTRFETPRVLTKNTHGTGCTYAAAIAAYLARGAHVHEAIEQSKQYLYGAILAAYEVGSGHSPVHHFYRLWKPDSRSKL
jgi:hydroxymethylpyrimidine/phosphomethylpyrimidine kinase